MLSMFQSAKVFWFLVALRYRLLWAQARTARGRTALLIVLYILGGMLLLFLNLGGVGAAVAAVRSGRGEDILRWVLAVVSASGIATGLSLGAGPRRAFAVSILRRYPMDPLCLFAARHITGFLDPTWTLLSALAGGVAAGYAVMGLRNIVAGFPAAILCVAASYLVTLILFALVDRTLSMKGGATILGAVVFILSTTACLAGPFLVASETSNWWRVVDRALVFTPPGGAASVLAGERTAFGAFILTAWCLALALVLAKLERREALPAAPPAAIIGECVYDRVESLFGTKSGPLVGRALRYHLRSNRARFNFAMSIPMMVFLPRLMSKNSSSDISFLLTLALFFCGGILGTGSIALNQFGYEGAGIRRYFLLPVSFNCALRAGSIASLLMGGMAVLPGLVLWASTAGANFEIRRTLMLLSSGCAGLFFFNALGIWTTVLEPRSLDFRSVVGNHLSTSGNAAVFGGMSLALGAAFILGSSGRCDTLLEHWWLLPLAAVLCSGMYVASLRLVKRCLMGRRESLAEILAGESVN